MYHSNKDKTYRLAWIVAVPLMVCMLLSGCSIGGEKKIKIFSVEQPREKLNYPLPTPLQMEEIYWHIITSENAEEVFKKLEEAGIDPVLFGITDKDFQVLARNFAQIRQKLQETNNLLQEYQKYYEGEENADSNKSNSRTPRCCGEQGNSRSTSS